jgi:hypothetical protein
MLLFQKRQCGSQQSRFVTPNSGITTTTAAMQIPARELPGRVRETSPEMDVIRR